MHRRKALVVHEAIDVVFRGEPVKHFVLVSPDTLVELAGDAYIQGPGAAGSNVDGVHWGT
jgi:hypothetical protein